MCVRGGVKFGGQGGGRGWCLNDPPFRPPLASFLRQAPAAHTHPHLSLSLSQTGVWNVRNVLDAYYENEGSEFEPYTLLLEVQDRPGVLNQVRAGLGMERGTRHDRLWVGPSGS